MHRFRVAMRRLRTTLKYHQNHLGACADKKIRRRARSLVVPTGEARDREVFALWLSETAATLHSTELPGLEWLQETTSSRVATEYEMVRSRIPPAFSRLEEDLDRCLSLPWKPTSRRFVDVAVDRTRHTAALFEASLEAWQAQPTDVARHRVRIAGKHVRYLLEPIAHVVVGGNELLEELKAFQDLFGVLQDTVAHSAAVLADLGTSFDDGLVEAVRQTLEEDSPARLTDTLDARAIGFLAVARHIRSRRDSLPKVLADRLVDGRVAELLVALRSVSLSG